MIQASSSLSLTQTAPPLPHSLIAVAVTDIKALEVEARECPTNVRVVVDADHHLALAAAHEVGHALVLFEGEVHAVTGSLPIRRVHVEERVRSIIALSAGEPGQVLDVGAGEALPRGEKVFLNAQQVDSWPSSCCTEGLPGDLAAEGVLLQVEESGCTLNVGENLRACHLLPLEDLTRAECPFELTHEFLEVVLYHPIERHQVAIEVVEHLHRRGLRAQEEQRSAAGEDFDITFMRGKEGDQAVGQAAFATHPGNDWIRHVIASPYCMDKQVLGSPRFVHGAGASAGLAGRVCGFGGQRGC